jgi:tRNA dimethylallyltransferase
VDVVAIFGPTASGKSAVALEVAELVGGEIVSCDAMQLYRGLPILTNQPPAADTTRAPHHVIGVWGLDHSGSVAEYAALAHAAIDDVVHRGRVAVVSGGSGLYLRAALAEMPLPPQVPAADRERFERLYEREGAGAAHATLAAADARAAAAVHPHDRRRVVRALELHAAGASLAPERDRLWAADARRPTAIVGLDAPAELVSARIARRTEAMFAAGVVAEVRSARATHTFSATAERIHGLQDVTALLKGRIDQSEAQRRLSVRTRRYAKRQRTWMRRLPEVAMVAADRDPRAIAAEIVASL